ncbi:hypothetical protein Kosp01_14190 [Kocuria sp. NBRC 114282]|nr:hypothetical protein Kosp01_14190 [Kocuria sp. NBRC 114282]
MRRRQRAGRRSEQLQCPAREVPHDQVPAGAEQAVVQRLDQNLEATRFVRETRREV